MIVLDREVLVKGYIPGSASLAGSHLRAHDCRRANRIGIVFAGLPACSKSISYGSSGLKLTS